MDAAAAPPEVDLLTLLDAFVRSDAELPGILGEVAIGVGTPERARWWRASFGGRLETELTERFPEGAHSILLLAPEDAEALVRRGAPRADGREIFIRGDKQLMKRFLERYLSGEGRRS